MAGRPTRRDPLPPPTGRWLKAEGQPPSLLLRPSQSALFCEAAATALAFRHPRPLLDMAASKYSKVFWVEFRIFKK